MLLSLSSGEPREFRKQCTNSICIFFVVISLYKNQLNGTSVVWFLKRNKWRMAKTLVKHSVKQNTECAKTASISKGVFEW